MAAGIYAGENVKHAVSIIRQKLPITFAMPLFIIWDQLITHNHFSLIILLYMSKWRDNNEEKGLVQLSETVLIERQGSFIIDSDLVVMVTINMMAVGNRARKKVIVVLRVWKLDTLI